jgi:DNA-binding HxlR family transcriptional regulator
MNIEENINLWLGVYTMKKYNIPVEAALEVIGGKWKVVILCHLIEGTKRTGGLKKLMPGITQKMLTQQLRELEDDGVILRKVYNQIPPKVEYSLTDYGWSLKEILDSLCSWGEQHIEKTYPCKEDVLLQPEERDTMKV